MNSFDSLPRALRGSKFQRAGVEYLGGVVTVFNMHSNASALERAINQDDSVFIACSGSRSKMVSNAAAAPVGFLLPCSHF